MMKSSVRKNSATIPDFLLGGGEMGQRIREFNWKHTPLGPLETWPHSLRTCVQIMLTSRQPIWIGWGNDLIKLYNDPYRAIVGGKHPWALGKPASVVWKDIWKDIDPMLHKVMRHNEGIYAESQLLIMERNGYPEETYYTFSYTPIAGDNGGTEGMICVNTDDTERIISERQLRTLTELGTALADVKTEQDLHAALIATLQTNPEDFPFALVYLHHNNKLHLTAHTELGSAAARIPTHIDLSQKGDVVDICLQCLNEKRMQIFGDLRQRLGDMPMGAWNLPPDKAMLLPVSRRGQPQPYALLVIGVNPFRLLDEKYKSFFNLVADQVATSVANIHALEEERRRREAMAEVDKAKTIFFSNISHEFRTPLTLLLGPLEEVAADADISPDRREKVSVAYRNALRMQKLVNLLLDFSRIEAGRMESNFVPVDIVAITSDLASNFRSAIEKAGMELILEMEAVEEPLYVDLEMWEKVVLNLMSNAFKYTERGAIKVSVRRRDNKVEFAVADTGIGIPASETEKIFERFHRVQNTLGRSQEGTGIGLAMVKELVKLHGGQISVESSPGKGSTFIVSIPLGTSHINGKEKSATSAHDSRQRRAYVEEAEQWTRTSASKEKEEVSTDSSPKPKHSYTVLIADDNADMRVFLTRLLSDNYNIISASDGEEAFTIAVREVPDLVLSDVMMPVVDGFELLKRLRENMSTRGIPFIFLSARAGEEAKVEGLDAGADDYLVKPFSSRELQARVANQISINTTRRKTEKEFFNLFRQSPVHIHVMKGPEHVVEFFHPLAVKFIGKDITGMKIREAVPFVEGQGYFELLDRVYNEGVSVHLTDSKASFPNDDGSTSEHYFNITYLPWRDTEGKVQGVLQFTFEVTETVQLRLLAESKEKKFRDIAQQAPVAMALLMGPDHIVEVANERVLELWGRTLDEVLYKPVLEVFPEIVVQGFDKLLRSVYETGEPFVANELPVVFKKDNVERSIFVNLLYQPFRGESGNIEGIVAVGTDVTEQVNARRKVAEAELRSRTIIEQTPSPLCIFKGEDMVLEVANEAALGVWQAGPEVIGKRLVDIVPEMERQIFLDLMLDVYNNGVTRFGFEAPAYFLRKDGQRELRYFNFYYVPFYDPDKTITGVLVLATDVTDMVVARKQLSDNEERLRIASEILELGTWEYDVTRDIVKLSDRARKILGNGLEPTVPIQKIFDAMIEEDRPRVAKAVQNAFANMNGGKFDQEFRVIEGEDKIRIVRSIAQSFFDSDGLPVRVVGTAIDITDRKRVEEKVVASEARFRLLTSSIPQIVWTSSKDGQTTFISDQFQTYTGSSPNTSLDSWHALIHPDDRERLVSTRSNAIAEGRPWQEEFRLSDGNGGYRWFLGKSTPQKNPNGEVIMYVGAASDIQDLKEQSVWLEQQVQERTRSLKDLNHSLKLSNEDLQQFAHVASHDLKEPIRKIKTFSNRLKDEFEHALPEKATGFLHKILSATDRMYNMIDGVLSYSTLASVEQPMEWVDLNDVIRQILVDLEVLIAERNASFTIEVLPKIYAAPVLMYQLFYNLINNSLKFARPGVPPVITMTATELMVEENKFEKILLSDNGIGFEPEHADKIFTTFTRLNSKDRFEGTGLGLALCRKIVQRHGGFISAHGEKDAGAEFTILLPARL